MGRGRGRYAIELRGGRYVIDPQTAEWHLLTGGGRFRKPSPVAQAWDASRSIPEAIRERLNRRVYIIAVLALPDMEPDETIADAAAQRHVDVIFGTDRWVERLVGLAGPHNIVLPPTEAQIEEEVAVVMPELAPQRAADPNPQVIIQRVDQLHLHIGPGSVQGLIGLTGSASGEPARAGGPDDAGGARPSCQVMTARPEKATTGGDCRLRLRSIAGLLPWGPQGQPQTDDSWAS